MKNPFRKRKLSPFTQMIMDQSAKGAYPIPRERELLAEVLELQEQVALLADANEELADTNNRRSLRMNKQLETSDVQTPESRVSELLGNERKLMAIARLLSGEAVDGATQMMRQIGNRLGMSNPDLERIYGRMDALQSLAVLRDKIRTGLAGIDWSSDVVFEFDEDEEAVEEVLNLLR